MYRADLSHSLRHNRKSTALTNVRRSAAAVCLTGEPNCGTKKQKIGAGGQKAHLGLWVVRPISMSYQMDRHRCLRSPHLVASLFRLALRSPLTKGTNQPLPRERRLSLRSSKGFFRHGSRKRRLQAQEGFCRHGSRKPEMMLRDRCEATRCATRKGLIWTAHRAVRHKAERKGDQQKVPTR
jgi:hypothetical protein